MKKNYVIGSMLPIAALCLGLLPTPALSTQAKADVASVQQATKVTGTVVDKSGPIIGATIKVKGTSIATITDLDGNFSLVNVPKNATLEITYIGYKTQTVALNGRTKVSVTLEEDAANLEEVVVVGYGVQKKSDVTGAMASVDAEKLMERPVSNAFEALQGKAAGVDITTNERPGELGEIHIRGMRSLSASNTPLYVVDGVPLMSSSAIESLNPRDIESIDILKDASATAIYGSRGANGVIIVTTKSGKAGQFHLNYTGSLTVSNIVDRSPSMNASDYITYRRWAAYNSDPTAYAHPDSPTKENDTLIFDSPGDNQTSRDNVLKGWANGTWDASLVDSYDWTDVVTQTGIAHEHTLSASGGSEKMNAYASFGYLDNEGTQKGQWYKRYTGKVSVNIDPVKWFSANASMNATFTDQDYGMSTLGGRSGSVPDAIYGTAKTLNSISPAYDSEGNLVIQPGGESAIYTIMDEWDKSTQRREAYRLFGNFSATLKLGEIWEPLKGLNYKIAFGPDFQYWREGVYIDGTSSHKMNSDGSAGTNYARRQTRRDFSWTLDNMITYNRTFNKVHNVGLTLLQTASKWTYETDAMSAVGLDKASYKWNAFGTIDLTNSDYQASMSSGITERQLESYMVRVNYGFADKYLLTASGRWDGASQLSEGHKWSFFPSVAIAWRIIQEDFMKSLPWVSNLKLRIGVGTTGNAAVSPYSTKGKISSFYLPFNGMSNQLAYAFNEPYYTSSQVSMANDNLGWERTTQWNFGLDFGFLNGRIGGSLEFYTSKTKDLLMSTTIPTLTGFPSIYANIGETSNHGVELTLDATPIKLKNGFTWESSFNAAWQKDKIDLLAYGKSDMPDNGWFIGESLAVYYGFENLGLWQDTEEDRAEMAKWAENGYNFEPGNVRPKDQNGDYEMTDEDRVVIGKQNPSWTLGWSNTFSYKNFDLSFSMIARLGYTFNTGGQSLTGHGNQMEVDYWTPDNTDAMYQKPILGELNSGSKDSYSSLIGYRDASYIKMRNISLGYNFDRNTLKRIGLSNLKIYAQCVNPFSLYQSIDGYDLDTGKTYFNRSFVFGLEVGF